jgi:hypothetical protein
VTDKPLGQIAYEAAWSWSHSPLPRWDGLPDGERAYWDHVAAAVAQAVAPVSLDEETYNEIRRLETPEEPS